MATATALVAAGLALLPDSGRRSPPLPLTAAGLLRTTAAVAADQPEPPAWAGFRYVEVAQPLDLPQRWRFDKGSRIPRLTGPPYTIAQDEEVLGRPPLARAAARAGRPGGGGGGRRRGEYFLKPHDMRAPSDMPNLYGDGPLANVPLERAADRAAGAL